MARVPFTRHLPVAKLRYRCVSCRHPVEKPRRHALRLLARTDHPRTPAEVADVVGSSAVTARHVPHRWNGRGPDGVADRRAGDGAAPRLTARRRDALYAALQKRPPDGGVWTGPKVARHVRDRWRIEVGPVTGWRWPRDLGLTLQAPRPSHPKSAAPAARRAWGRTRGGG